MCRPAAAAQRRDRGDPGAGPDARPARVDRAWSEGGARGGKKAVAPGRAVRRVRVAPRVGGHQCIRRGAGAGPAGTRRRTSWADHLIAGTIGPPRRSARADQDDSDGLAL